MWVLVVSLPILTALLASACVLWPGGRRLIGPALVLAVLCVVLAPVTSGEWFYQQAEMPDYDQAVARGDFTTLENLVRRHDPHLMPRMIGIAGALLACLSLWAVLAFRADRGKPTPGPTRAVATGLVLLAALTLVAQALLVVRQAGAFQ